MFVFLTAVLFLRPKQVTPFVYLLFLSLSLCPSLSLRLLALDVDEREERQRVAEARAALEVGQLDDGGALDDNAAGLACG